MFVVGRGLKKRAGHFRPIVGGRNSEGFLLVEVVEKRPLGNAGRVANVIHGR